MGKKQLIILDNRVRLVKKGIPKEVLKSLKETCRHDNPEYHILRAMGRWGKGVPRTIPTYRFADGGKVITFPRGAFWRVLDSLSEYGIRTKVRDNRFTGSRIQYDWNVDDGFEWRPYQLEAIDRILEEESCILEGGPASGKTEILLGAIARAGLRAAVIAPTKEIFDQWVRRAAYRFRLPERSIGAIGAGKDRMGSILTVMTPRSALNRVERLKGEFGFVGLDEAHHAPAATFLELMGSFPAKYRVGATATIERQDLKHFLTHDLFGETAFSISRDDLKAMGYTADVTFHVVKTEFEYDYMNENQILEFCEETGEDFESLRVVDKEKIGKDLGLESRNYPDYLTTVAKDIPRNNLVFKYLKKEYDQGNSCAIFTKRRRHCVMWRDVLRRVGIEVAILWRGKNAAERRQVQRDLERLKSGAIRVGIGTTIDEGVNMPSVKAGFITYRNAKNRGQLIQQVGRVERLFKGRQGANLYYFHDHRIQRFEKDIAALKRIFRKVVIHG